jgi:FtsP/CotA-like multicopper oxidase with cupredoxin domain
MRSPSPRLRLRRAAIALAAIATFAAPAFAPAQPRLRRAADGGASRLAPVTRVVPNDNRARAGTLRDGVLSIALVATEGMWYPDADAAPGVRMQAFAEAGRAPRIPGPLIRAAAGTPIALTLRNTLDEPLTVWGLRGGNSPDSLQIAAGSTRSIRTRFDSAGTFYYWGSSSGRSMDWRTGLDAQLSGAIIIDEPGIRAPHDRIFVLGMWADTVGRVLTNRSRVLVVVNGRSWPNTERLQQTVGDTVHWRLLNPSADSHPMHLHGFYFRVDGRGNGSADVRFAPSAADRVNTEPMPGGATIDLTWIPERAGNWLFHCHLPEHFAARGSLGLRLPERLAGAQAGHAAMNHALQEMSGLVIGVHVRDRGAPLAVAATPARALRLLVRENAGSTLETPFFAFAWQEGAVVPAADSGMRVGPPIVLTRGQPVRINVVNALREPTAVHWHGIELDSYYDGVAGFSGAGKRLSPVIAPGDSFEVRFTPPRSGTFIYHTHVDEERQQLAGLAGPLLVVEPGARDARSDHSVLITSPGALALSRTSVLLNGMLTPAPLALVAGRANRVRLVNITTRRPNLRVELRDDSGVVAWRPVSKDGLAIPPAGRIMRPGMRVVSIGETFDFEIEPGVAGAAGLRLEMYAATQRIGVFPIVVRK